MRKAKRTGSKGFTLVETIIAVAIMVVGFSVAGIAANDVKNDLKQTDLDATARHLYVVAQDNLTKLYSSGKTEAFDPESGSTEIGYVTTKPLDYEGSTSDYNNNLCYIKSQKIGDERGPISKTLFPDAIESYLDNQWIVEYNPSSGIITSVFYSDGGDTSYAFYEYEKSQNQSTSLRFTDSAHRENRIDYMKDTKVGVGYYGGLELLSESNRSEYNANLGKCEVVIETPVDDNTSLTIPYTITPPSEAKSGSNAYNVVLELKYIGEQSGKIWARDIDLGGLNASVNKTVEGINIKYDTASGKFTATHLIDSLAAGQAFADNAVFAGFYPGENITVKAMAYLTLNGSALDRTNSEIAVKYLNSLYADLSTDGQAVIKTARHLQNLNNNHENVEVKGAVQQSDIDLSGISFKPISNEDLREYEGSNHKIINLNADIDGLTGGKHAGLFETFGSTDNMNPAAVISNLTLENPKARTIKEGGHAGTLVGQTNGKVEINNCGVHLDPSATKGANVANQIKVESKYGYAGGLVGYANGEVTFRKSYAATVVSGCDYAGGLVGLAYNNARFIQSYADCYLNANQIGGIAGKAENSTIFNCYAVGEPFTVTGKTINYAYGLIGGHVAKAMTSYTVFDLSSLVGKAIYTNLHTTFDSCSSITRVYYLNTMMGKNFSAYADKVHDSAVLSGTIPKTHYGLSNSESKDDSSNSTWVSLLFVDGDNTKLDGVQTKYMLIGSHTEKSHVYNYSPKNLDVYPYPIIDGLPHYGDWNVKQGTDNMYGLLYWEKEESDAGEKYNTYFVSFNPKERNRTFETDNLCKQHDDGGRIVEYGYGYMIKEDYMKDTTVSWDPDSVPYDSVNKTVKATPNTVAAKAIEKQVNRSNDMHYKVVCYTTMDAFKDADTNTGADDFYLTNNKFFTTVKFNYTCDVAENDDLPKQYWYQFCPYFAADICCTASEDEAGWLAQVTDEMLMSTTYYQTFNSYARLATVPNSNGGSDQYIDLGKPKAHQIRSIEQLQYLNWNGIEKNTNTLSTVTNHLNAGYLRYNEFPFLCAKTLSNLGTDLVNFDSSIYKQTHDIDAEHIGDYDYTPIAAMGSLGLNVSGMLTAYNWFGGEFDGQSYVIKNLNITSDAYSIGVFGTAVGARFSNVIMTSDSKSRIKREYGGDSAGDYFMGGLVGLASRPTLDILTTAKIDNCAIGNYTIIDKTGHNTSILSGGSNVGGLVGACRLRIFNSQAVVDIRMDSESELGVVNVGGLAGSANGSYTSLGGATIYNCYTGGSIVFEDGTNEKQKAYHVGGIIGSNDKVRVSNIAGLDGDYNSSISIYKSYTYMSLPQSDASWNLLAKRDSIKTIGRIMGNSASATTNQIINCGYYDASAPNTPVNNTSNLLLLANNYIEGTMDNTISYQIDSSILNAILSGTNNGSGATRTLFGLIAYNNAGLKSLAGNVPADLTYAAGGVHEKTSAADENAYPFRTAVTRAYADGATKTVHVGTWPGDTTVVTLHNEAPSAGSDVTFTAKLGTAASSLDAYVPAAVTWEHHTFGGYYYGEEQIIGVDGKFITTSSLFTDGKWNYSYNTLKLEARWIAEKYTITLKDPLITENNGVYNTIEYTVDSDDFTLEIPEKAGYKFISWIDEADSKEYASVTIKKGTTGNKTYQVKWQQTGFAINYQNVLDTDTFANGVSNPVTYYIDTPTITLANPSRPGYIFVGWTTPEDGTLRMTATIEKGSTGEKTFIANWKQYEVTLVSSGFTGGSAAAYLGVNSDGKYYVLGYDTTKGGEGNADVHSVVVGDNTLERSDVTLDNGVTSKITDASRYYLEGWYIKDGSNYIKILDENGVLTDLSYLSRFDSDYKLSVTSRWSITYNNAYVSINPGSSLKKNGEYLIAGVLNDGSNKPAQLVSSDVTGSIRISGKQRQYYELTTTDINLSHTVNSSGKAAAFAVGDYTTWVYDGGFKYGNYGYLVTQGVGRLTEALVSNDSKFYKLNSITYGSDSKLKVYSSTYININPVKDLSGSMRYNPTLSSEADNLFILEHVTNYQVTDYGK